MMYSYRVSRPAMTATRLAVCLIVFAAQAKSSDCTRTSVGLTPLSELGTRLYQGQQYWDITGSRPATAGVIVEVHDSNNRQLTTHTATVAGGRSEAFVLSTLPGLQPVNLVSGYVRVTSDQPFAGIALFATHNNSVISAIPSLSSYK